MIINIQLTESQAEALVIALDGLEKTWVGSEVVSKHFSPVCGYLRQCLILRQDGYSDGFNA